MAMTQPNKAIAEWEAAQLWQTYGFRGPDELVLEDLAWAMGVAVLEGELEHAEARLVRRGTKGLIRIRGNLPELGRKKFAISHELGHWVLHEHISHVFLCTSEDMVARFKAKAVELEANYFATELLMPSSLFGPAIAEEPFSVDTVSQIAADYRTSFTATALRFVELTDTYCVLVVSKGGRVTWWRKSLAWGDMFWLDPGSSLSRDTVAGGLTRGEDIPSRPVEVALSAWTDDAESFEDDVVVEETLVMKRYGQTVSLLQVP
jgi:Zn-dependent peptidase ImmA (M78 family)